MICTRWKQWNNAHSKSPSWCIGKVQICPREQKQSELEDFLFIYKDILQFSGAKTVLIKAVTQNYIGIHRRIWNNCKQTGKMKWCSVARVSWVLHMANRDLHVGVVAVIGVVVMSMASHSDSSSGSSSSSVVVASPSESQMEREQVQQLEQSQDDDKGLHNFLRHSKVVA